MKNLLLKLKKWYSALPDKKRHVELITALLTVPMMLTVILVNMNNIKSQKDKVPGTTTTPAPIQVVINNPNTTATPTATKVTAITTPTVTPTALPTKTACKNEIGPVVILSPLEGEVVTTDKVSISISTDSNYCPVTWSYKLDDDNWSDFSNNNIYLYNLTAGKKQLEVKVKNAAGDKTITLERNFIYKSSTVVTATPTASTSASTTQ